MGIQTIPNTLLKYNRYYLLQINVDKKTTIYGQPDQTFWYSLPITCEFEITQNVLGGINNMSLRLYNLSLNARDMIRKNLYDQNIGITIALRAGYQNNNNILFTGNVYEAWSERQGTEFITYLECFDGGAAFVMAEANQSFSKGTPVKTVIQTMQAAFSPWGVAPGKTSNFPGELPKDTSYTGNVAQILKRETGGGFFISKGQAHCLLPTDALPNSAKPGQSFVISDVSGLLGTPKYMQTYIEVEMLLEPNLEIATIVQLNSQTLPKYNANYFVSSLSHRAIISPVVSGDAITTIGMNAGNFTVLE